MTMSRINLIKGIGPVLQIAEGWTVDLPPEVHHQLNERTDPTWPYIGSHQTLPGRVLSMMSTPSWQIGEQITVR